MVDRPILRFPDPVPSSRRKRSGAYPLQPGGPKREVQGRRFQGEFDRLEEALNTDNPEVVLRSDPVGIAPERALVFVTAGSVQDFARAAGEIGLEVFAENELEEIEDFPEGFTPPGKRLARTLYATMPTLQSFKKILSLWNEYKKDEPAPRGASPWWNAFDLLLELRPWGPNDRLIEDARKVIEDFLSLNENREVPIEFEVWPCENTEKRARWRDETEKHITSLGGRIIDRSSITGNGFIYEAILAGMPAHAVRMMLDNPGKAGGLATIEGVQFIFPQTIGQATLGDIEGEISEHEGQGTFVADAPIRAALFDGTPVAGHALLNGGVVIEDVHDLVRLSPVNQRYHATEMASLILRGDLEDDGRALTDTRLVSVPLLIDSDNEARSPENRLFVDLVHSALMQLIIGAEPIAEDVFIVNFSIGVPDMRFAGRVSALARLMDWWAAKEGVLFVISAGNISDNLILQGVKSIAFEEYNKNKRRQTVLDAMYASTYGRTLLAPAEALNGMTVGAISKDLSGHVPSDQAGIMTLENDSDLKPQLTSALGLGMNRMIKPDLLETGGRLEVRAFPNGDDTRLCPISAGQRTGLVAASPRGDAHGTRKTRGTSQAAALTTRAILQAAEVLTGEGGPYEGQELPRRKLALLCRALAVNASRWPADARGLYEEQLDRLGARQHARAKEEVCRHFGYGVIAPERMQRSPEGGVTMVSIGSIRKNQAQIFRMPFPPSMAGDRVPRSMRITISWFSPLNPARAKYRLASLEAVVVNDIDDKEDKGWGLDLKSDGPDANMVKRGSVWSRRMVNRVQTVPDFCKADISICVQCRETARGGLSPDEDIAFAIVVTLEIEAEVQYDILDEIKQQIHLRLHPVA